MSRARDATTGARRSRRGLQGSARARAPRPGSHEAPLRRRTPLTKTGRRAQPSRAPRLPPSSKRRICIMRRIFLIAVLSVAMLGFASAAQAVTDFSNAPQGAHYANGSAEPVCTLSGLTVTCTGTEIVGVGNTNATVELAVTSTISGVCENPGVNNKVVEPFSESVTETTSTEL